jgi:hypothetical protein
MDKVNLEDYKVKLKHIELNKFATKAELDELRILLQEHGTPRDRTEEKEYLRKFQENDDTTRQLIKQQETQQMEIRQFRKQITSFDDLLHK